MQCWQREGVGNVLAASLGVVTPFCSCSAVPLFIRFVEAGIPLGVTFSFLIAAPMVNEAALAILFGTFGWAHRCALPGSRAGDRHCVGGDHRRVLKPRLIATFIGIVALGLIAIGHVFNLVI